MKNLIFLFTLFFLACAQKTPRPDSESARFNNILTEYAEANKRQDAFYASYFNVEENLSKFGDYLSPEFLARGKNQVQKSLAQLSTINPQLLSKKERVAYDLFKEDLQINLKEYDFPGDLLSVSPKWHRLTNYLDDSSPALTSFPFDSLKHYQDFIERSEGFLPFIDRQINALREGIKQGYVLNCEVAAKTPNSYKEGLEADVLKHPFYRPVIRIPANIKSTDQESLRQGFIKMIKERIQPGFVKFDQFYRQEYLPQCRKGFGFGSYPEGKAWYAHRVFAHTNSTMSADEIHSLGLKEVAQIRKEMSRVMKDLKFQGSYKKFINKITTDPRSFFKSRQDILAAFQEVRLTIDQKIPQYFSLIPKTEYKLVEAENPEEAAASYRDPTENLPFGRFVINTLNLKANATYGVTTLSLHEAVPGHHFQLALQFEQKEDLTEYQRKMFFSTAFVEGWALYAEYLGREMGLFTDPWQMLGHLSDQMLRAVRLVVDTGIHSKDWSRKKSIQYMADNLAMDLKDIESEVDRYSVNPGQALAYKIGQLKILELRQNAERALGSRFDIREFHRAVLGQGSLSLTVLERQVQDWIQSVQATQ